MYLIVTIIIYFNAASSTARTPKAPSLNPYDFVYSGDSLKVKPAVKVHGDNNVLKSKTNTLNSGDVLLFKTSSKPLATIKEVNVTPTDPSPTQNNKYLHQIST